MLPLSLGNIFDNFRHLSVGFPNLSASYKGNKRTSYYATASQDEPAIWLAKSKAREV